VVKLYEYKGKALRATEISKISGIPYATLMLRIKTGVPLDRELGLSKFLTFNGKTMNQKQWAAELNLGRTTISMRLKRGLPIEEVLRANLS
jgi:hypothetical protein